jgi:predicted kinase
MGQSESTLREKLECTAKECELTKEIAEGLSRESMVILRKYAKAHGISCGTMDARQKANWCKAIAQEVERSRIDTLVKLAMTICKRVKEDSQSAEESASLERTLAQMGIQGSGLTDVERCEAMTDRFQAIIEDLERLKEASSWSPRHTGRYAKLQRALLSTLLLYAATASAQPVDALTTEVCPFTPGVPRIEGLAAPSVCQLDLATSKTGQFQRYWMTGDIVPEVENMPSDRALVDDIRRDIYSKRMPGDQIKPTAVFLLGGSGAGKTTTFQKFVAENKELEIGIRGAISLNSDEIMEDLPGYTTMLTLGEYGGVPVSNKAAANIYHEPAKKIMKSLMREAREEHQSIIFDGTGNNQANLERTMEEFKEAGFAVNIIAVAAPVEVRQNRVEQRGITSGRFVPPTVVQEGRSEGEWQHFLDTWKSQGKVDFGMVYTNA